MHELSIALDVCRIAEEQLGPASLASLTTVALDVGKRSGIEIDNLEFCLEVLLGNPPFGNARPLISRLDGDELRVTYLEVEDDDGP